MARNPDLQEEGEFEIMGIVLQILRVASLQHLLLTHHNFFL